MPLVKCSLFGMKGMIVSKTGSVINDDVQRGEVADDP